MKQEKPPSSNPKENKKRKELLFSLVILIFALGLGIFAALSSWNGRMYFYPSPSSDPARKPSSLLEGTEEEGVKRNIQSYTRDQESPHSFLTHSKVETNEDGAFVTFGHALLSDKEGNKALACDVYNKIEAVFHSGDMAINGSPSAMIVRSPCLAEDSDSENMKALYLPLQEFYQEEPKNESFSLVLNDTPYHFTFENMGFSWPQIWYLKSVRLYSELAELPPENETLWAESEEEEGENSAAAEERKWAAEEGKKRSSLFNKEFQLNHREILEIRREPLTIEWKSKD